MNFLKKKSLVLSQKDLVSIIVPVRYRPDLTAVALDSLFKYTPENFELILIQEGNEKGIAEVLRNYKAKIIYHAKPKGYPKAINAGYKKVSANAKYVMFLNSIKKF